MALTEPFEAAVVAVAQIALSTDAEADLLALHVAAAREMADRLVHPEVRKERVAGDLRPHREREDRHQEHQHRGAESPALPPVLHQLAEREAEPGGDHQDGHALEEVGEGGGVLEGMGRVHVEEPAPVGAQLLDGDLRGRGTQGRAGLVRAVPS
jgi:hypothetical protein